jgi:hypothetical protein
MARIVVSAERVVDAPADAAWRYVADMRDHHPRFPPRGTIARFTVTAGGCIREYRMRVDEPEPGRVLTESDTGSSLVTTTTVSPRDGTSLVQISMAWDRTGGPGRLFERMFAPRAIRSIYADELERLDAYAHKQCPDKPGRSAAARVGASRTRAPPTQSGPRHDSMR